MDLAGPDRLYDGGVVLRYEQQQMTDEYGMLADLLFDADNAGEEGVEELDEDEYRAATVRLGRRPSPR